MQLSLSSRFLEEAKGRNVSRVGTNSPIKKTDIPGGCDVQCRETDLLKPNHGWGDIATTQLDYSTVADDDVEDSIVEDSIVEDSIVTNRYFQGRLI